MRALTTALRAEGRGVELGLAPLDRAETATLAQRLTGAPPPGPELDRLHADTGGNPLFVVEAVRAGRDGARPRVQAVIEARLARLPAPARALAETAALIGRGFGVDVLAAAAAVDEDTLVTGLDELWRRGIVRERGTPTTSATTASVRWPRPGSARHAGGGCTCASPRCWSGAPTPPSSPRRSPAISRTARAAQWYLRAAGAVALLHADTRGIDLLESALDQLGTLPSSRDRDVTELAACTALLAPLAAVHGYASPALTAAQRRARELTSLLALEPAPTLLRSQAMSASTGGDFAAAMRIGEQLRAAGERDGDGVLVVEGAFLLGVAAFWAADFPAAQRHLEHAVATYRPANGRAHLVHYGNDPKVACLARLGNTQWALGRPDEARAAGAAALAWAEEIGHGYSLEIARWFGALLALDMGDEERLRAHTAALADAESAQVRLGASALRGYLTVRDGRATDGLAAVRAAIDSGRGHEAPGLDACLHRILLAAHLAADDGRALAWGPSRTGRADQHPARRPVPHCPPARTEPHCCSERGGTAMTFRSRGSITAVVACRQPPRRSRCDVPGRGAPHRHRVHRTVAGTPVRPRRRRCRGPIAARSDRTRPR